MEAILSATCLSLTGTLGRGFGYYLHRRNNRFYAVRMRGTIPPEGHWRFIVLCAELAQNKLHISDIKIGWVELGNALCEARLFVANRHVRQSGVRGVKTTYNAADIINLKKTFGL